MSYFRNNIDAMEGYRPGEQPPPGAPVVKLNTNESPYPPSPRAVEAMRQFNPVLLGRYPDPLSLGVRRAAGRVLGFELQWIIAGNGSDDLLSGLVRACVGEGQAVAMPVPTYVLYETLAQIQAAQVVTVPFDDAYHLPTEELARANARITFVANPNSPSGTMVGAEQLRDLAGRLSGLLVIDEAYVDFADGNCLELVRQCPNVVVLRTLSKSYSLAGLRLGLGIAQPPVIAGLMKVKDSYNLDSLAQAIGSAALEDQAWMLRNVALVRQERQRLTAELERRGFRVWPSQSNFLLAGVPGGDGRSVYRALKARGVLVRYFHQDRLYDKLRITVGSPQQNDALLSALDARAAGAQP